jgi:hypothetical protein
MISGPFSSVRRTAVHRRVEITALACIVAICGWHTTAWGDDAVSNSSKRKVAQPAGSKHIIGATATITEVSTGIPFSARIDTGAKTCSLHVENIHIEDESPRRLDNIGKPIRFDLIGEDGKSQRVESTIAAAVRVRSSVFKNGEFDRRYKVRLTLQWKDFSKEVLVTLNDRTDMDYPLLIGRNFLRGDFLVDVEKNRGDE